MSRSRCQACSEWMTTSTPTEKTPGEEFGEIEGKRVCTKCAPAIQEKYKRAAADPYVLCQCDSCLLQGNYIIKGAGPIPADLMIVGEGPGRQEVAFGEPFVGRSGKLVNALLEDCGLQRSEAFLTNMACCTTVDADGKPQKPSKESIDACGDRLLWEIRRVKPKIILSLGRTASTALLRTRESLAKISGDMKFSEELDCWVMPTYHPAAILRGQIDWFEDLHDAFQRVSMYLSGELGFPDRDPHPKFPVIHCTTKKEVTQALSALRHKKKLSLDIETDNLRHTHPMLLVGFYDGCAAWVLEWEIINHDPLLLHKFRQLLRDPSRTWILHNMAFDLRFIRHYVGEYPAGKCIDTMCLALGVTENGRRVGLKKQARQRLNAPEWEADLKSHLDPENPLFSQIPRKRLVEYLSFDVYYTYHLEAALVPVVEKEGTAGLVKDLLQPAQLVFADLERQGICVNRAYANELVEIWGPKIEEARRELQDFAYGKGFRNADDSPLNPNSSPQLIRLVFDVLGYPLVERKKTTGKAFLELYPEHEVARLIGQYRAMTKMMGTYIRGITRHIWEDGKIHPDFLIFGTATGRIVIKSPALQTIPREGTAAEKFQSIKRLFVAPPGFVIANIDFQQLEVRLAWHYSGDGNLGKAVEQDFHTLNATHMFRKPAEKITKEERSKAKALGFGVFYGMQADLASHHLRCPKSKAQAYIDRFFNAYPKYSKWYQETARKAVKTGELQTPFGRKRRWRLISKSTVAEIRRQAVNFPIQSAGADMCLHALIEIHWELQKRGWGRALFTVHDSIVAQLREEALDEALAYICQEMETPPFPTCATFKVDVEVGPTWGDTEKYERKELEVPVGC